MSNFKDVVNYAIDQVQNKEGVVLNELHNACFNVDLFVMSDYKAEKWLIKYTQNYIFEAIGKVVKYEIDNYGELTTDVSNPMKLVNMLVYVIGEEIFSEIKTIQDNWDKELTEDLINEIVIELQKLL